MLITGWRIIRTASRLIIVVSLPRSELFAARLPTDWFKTVGRLAASQASGSGQRVDQNADDTDEKVARDRQQTTEETAHVCLTSSCSVSRGAPRKALRVLAWSPARGGNAHCEPLILAVARLDHDTVPLQQQATGAIAHARYIGIGTYS
jgi:hypothetical protein